ncbi:conserved Plasmodium protein, unknown function [Plasmodium ovale wallikeri]|uniref:Uncharacterized protein n=2 Tax=Plasmodium ovale TaxID=36330 RepID=A0A1A8Z4A6_PLAOA|nr:conserved Plasmodium protein, unknown function [Plasmodium ovale wallikeri]
MFLSPVVCSTLFTRSNFNYALVATTCTQLHFLPGVFFFFFFFLAPLFHFQMRNKHDSDSMVSQTYEASLRKLAESIENGKHLVRGEKERKINFMDIEFNIQKHANAMNKLIRESNLIRTSARNSINDFYNSFTKCEEHFDKLSPDDINQKINNVFNGVEAEINNKCKPVVL